MADIVATIPGRAPAGMKRSAWLRPKYVLFGFIACMYAYVLWHNESFLIRPSDPEWTHIELFKWFLLPHGLTAACALFLGPLQFSERLRRRFTKAHRVVGRFYVAGVLMGAPIGFYIQHFEGVRMYANDPTSLSFTFAAGADAMVWIFCTLMALAMILRGKVEMHRQWMTRSFACALIFLEVRVIDGVFGMQNKFDEIIVWSCVVAAVPLADLVLQMQEMLRRRGAGVSKAAAAAD
jgi:uncharacterized membrane protein